MSSMNQRYLMQRSAINHSIDMTSKGPKHSQNMNHANLVKVRNLRNNFNNSVPARNSSDRFERILNEIERKAPVLGGVLGAEKMSLRKKKRNPDITVIFKSNDGESRQSLNKRISTALMKEHNL